MKKEIIFLFIFTLTTLMIFSCEDMEASSVEVITTGPADYSHFCRMCDDTYVYQVEFRNDDTPEDQTIEQTLKYRPFEDDTWTEIINDNSSSYSMVPSSLEVGEYWLEILYSDVEDDASAEWHWEIRNHVDIFSPSDGMVIEGNEINFRWTPLECTGFDYRLIVYNFMNDTIISEIVPEGSSSYEYTSFVPSGSYSWSVLFEPHNGIPPEVHSFEYNPAISQLSPEDDAWISSMPINFRWETIDDIDSTKLLLWKSESYDTAKYDIPSSTISIDTTLSEGIYNWQVYLYHDDTNIISQIRSFAWVLSI
ncbi:MAG: hypothetical protein ACLFSQ_05820 [Candidatus Zixiibacteriota bacterium]